VKSQTIPQLKYYEIIHNNDINHNIVKRSATYSRDNKNENENNDSVHKVSFRAINRDFNLLLNSNKDIMWSQFNAYTVDSKGRKKAIFVDFKDFYFGKVDGINGSRVRAHILPNGLMTATINTLNDVYEIEPIWRHFADHNNNYSSMIVFKHSDIKHSWTLNNNKSQKFCDFVKVEDNVTDSDSEFNNRIRRKRQTYFDIQEVLHGEEDEQFVPVGTHCAVVLVADYFFFKTMGNSDEKITINYLIHIIDRVNNIFNNTEWKDDERGHGFKGMGFWIKEILIHKDFSEGVDHYNSKGTKWAVRDLLEAFSREPVINQFCLAHLFTHQTFENSVLGLAYVASPRPTSVGGICSPSYSKDDKILYLNSGLTTTKNAFGHGIITREAVLVTAHEFGHNWGSEHDPHTDECSPAAKKGGSYIMYTYSVSGYDENNKVSDYCFYINLISLIMVL
jgi:disintegrin and metalloproteinase domain-containing protein 17